MKFNKKIFKHFEENSERYPKKIAFADEELEINWRQAFDIVLRISSEISRKIPRNSERPQDKGIVVKGDGSVFHVLMIYAIVLNRLVYIPYNRTLERGDTNLFNSLPTVTIYRNEIHYQGLKWSISDEVVNEIAIEASFEANETAAAFYYTSGTTGDPKVIVNSDSNIFRGAEFVSTALGLSNKDVIAGTLLLDFDYGVNQIFCNLVLGATYVSSPFSSVNSHWIKIIEKYKTTVVPTMPFLIESYFPKQPTTAIASVRLCTSSGAPLTLAHATKIASLFPNAEIIPMYGLSEGFRATILPPGEYYSRPNSVGKPIGDTEIRIVRNGLEECAVGEIGEIIQSSGCTSWGYFGDPENTDSKFVRDVGFPNRLWIRSGDLGCLDSDGYLYIQGRVESQIKLFGMRISVDEIESKYKSLKGIENAVVIPVTVNETESNFMVGVVSSLSIEEIMKELLSLPREFRTSNLRKIKEVIGNYNGGKPDRKANREKYFDN
jgi:acyl-CoA synthetase (AMP-forming)/AMP-acid ligase II